MSDQNNIECSVTYPPCPICNTAVSGVSRNVIWTRCPGCQAMVFPHNDGKKVLIAHHSWKTSELTAEALFESGFHPLRAEHGEHAVQILDSHKPGALVLDVGLERILSFQLIDQIRQDPSLQTIKIVLISSVFNKTAYKSQPSSLYGADDYVEHHHILDKLPHKLRFLLGENQEDVKQKVVSNPISETDDISVNRQLMDMARRVVSDIALYHQSEIDQILEDDQIDILSPALAEGRRILASQVGKTSLTTSDPVLEAFKELIGKLRKLRKK